MSAVDTLDVHYPAYNVMDRLESWDSHTKEIIRQRLGPFTAGKTLSDHESSCLAHLAQNIIYDDRNDIISWIVHHLDEKLSSTIGEAQRDIGIKPKKEFIREGLKFLEHAAKSKYHRGFTELTGQQQCELISRLQKGQAARDRDWPDSSQKKLFESLVGHIVGAYYSHPAVWSEIGYGGPVYPNVYARIELGLTDPWEAKRVGE